MTTTLRCKANKAKKNSVEEEMRRVPWYTAVLDENNNTNDVSYPVNAMTDTTDEPDAAAENFNVLGQLHPVPDDLDAIADNDHVTLNFSPGPVGRIFLQTRRRHQLNLLRWCHGAVANVVLSSDSQHWRSQCGAELTTKNVNVVHVAASAVPRVGRSRKREQQSYNDTSVPITLLPVSCKQLTCPFGAANNTNTNVPLVPMSRSSCREKSVLVRSETIHQLEHLLGFLKSRFHDSTSCLLCADETKC